MNICDENASMMWCGLLCILINELLRYVIQDKNYYWYSEYIFVYSQSGDVSHILLSDYMQPKVGLYYIFHMSYIICVVVMKEACSVIQNGD